MGLAPGTLLGNRFFVRALLARGGMGEVWTAEDRQNGAEVAVKTLRDTALAMPSVALRFAREAEILARIASPGIPALIAAVEHDGRLHLVIERLVGETLEERLRRLRVMTLHELRPILVHVLAALSDAHAAAVVHRDLKPDNVFLVFTNGRETAKVIDFGVSRALSDDDGEGLTTEGATLGSLGYMAPEQLANPSAVDGRADVYAVGAIAFRALTGALPFPEKTGLGLLQLKREFEAPTLDEATGTTWPEDVSRFVANCLARDPAARFASAAEARSALLAVGQLSIARPRSPAAAPDADSTSTMARAPRKRKT
ncbi:serine/threonine-protein kinase [soil metagenome]